MCVRVTALGSRLVLGGGAHPMVQPAIGAQWAFCVSEHRLNQLISLTPNQCGFVTEKGTSDAIQTIRILLEKTKTNKKNLHMVFIDLEKAFDHVPRDLIWEALRSQLVPESYISLIKDMYTDLKTQVVSPAGKSDSFSITAGVHQGSTLSPLLFNVTIDYLTKSCQKPVPWNILNADDVALISEDIDDLQHTFNTWIDALEKMGSRLAERKLSICRKCACCVGRAGGVTLLDKIRNDNEEVLKSHLYPRNLKKIVSGGTGISYVAQKIIWSS
ncbi:uncharacterized protein LOC134753743 [Cydia strobilella]|uniref:uncharacterized protein LOC134753743 n=1 Tax=Cydia strobilella TaxID=1100964 RepID=UPI003004C101